MNRTRFFSVAVFVLFIAIVVARPYHLSLIIFAGIDALAAIGLVLLMRVGQISLGHASFVGIGAYSSAILARDLHWSPWFAIVAGVIGAAVAAVPIGWVTLRLKERYLPLATLAWGMAVYVLFVAAAPITGGASGLDHIPPLKMAGIVVSDDKGFALIVWSIVVLSCLSVALLMKSRQGRAILAVKEHEQMAIAFGVKPSQVKMQVFVLSAALAGLAGALYTFQTLFISPTLFGVAQSFTLLVVAVLGGISHPAGAVVGALLVAAINFTIQSFFSGLIDRLGPIEPVIFGCLLIVLLLKWPNGLWASIDACLRRRVIEAPAVPLPQRHVSPVATVAKPLLELRGVSKNFGGVQALRDLSLEVSQGHILGLIGPNGAGKSTAFNVMSGLSRPSSGQVRLRGRALPPDPWDVATEGIARTFQHVKLVGDMTVVENVAIGCYSQGGSGVLATMIGLGNQRERSIIGRAFEALAQVGLADSANLLAGSLPLGKQRLVEIARSIAADPVLLLLDEPAAGLRATEKRNLILLLRRLKERGMSVVVVEHDMELVMRLVDLICVLDRGSLLAEGPPGHIRKDRSVIDAYLGNAA